jgi:hypothetical protein
MIVLIIINSILALIFGVIAIVSASNVDKMRKHLRILDERNPQYNEEKKLLKEEILRACAACMVYIIFLLVIGELIGHV